jgi:hypothetical protein
VPALSLVSLLASTLMLPLIVLVRLVLPVQQTLLLLALVKLPGAAVGLLTPLSATAA